ncbi:hypothetical protein [Vibrio owensii]|uniref:hypothetical protein n=1 Tax=Vibrio owensii TaxID=696485 RepID=UPI0003AA2449|nr:hypothetical protein [Vibrio owensii]
MKRTLSALTLCSVLVSFDSSALLCVNCASFTQMMTSNLNQAQSYVEEVQQTLNSVKNVQYQVQNLKNLKNMEWGDIQSQLRNLNTIASCGQSICFAMANMNQQFERWHRSLSESVDWRHELGEHLSAAGQCPARYGAKLTGTGVLRPPSR